MNLYYHWPYDELLSRLFIDPSICWFTSCYFLLMSMKSKWCGKITRLVLRTSSCSEAILCFSDAPCRPTSVTSSLSTPGSLIATTFTPPPPIGVNPNPPKPTQLSNTNQNNRMAADWWKLCALILIRNPSVSYRTLHPVLSL